MEPLLTDDDGLVEFLIAAENIEYALNFKVYEVEGWELPSNKPIDLQLYLQGTIKWDGCSHITFGDEGENGITTGYMHLCGGYYFKQHCRLMDALFEYAAKNITMWDDKVAR